MSCSHAARASSLCENRVGCSRGANVPVGQWFSVHRAIEEGFRRCAECRYWMGCSKKDLGEPAAAGQIRGGVEET